MNFQFLKFARNYGLRNLLRHKRRSLLTLSAIAFAFSVSLIAARYSTAIMDLWKEGASNRGTAHAQVHAQGFWEKQEGLDENLTLVFNNTAEKDILADPDVDSVARRTRFEGLIATDTASAFFVGVGVEPDNELKVSPKIFYPGYDQGEFVQQGNLTGINIGRGLAKKLNLKLGSTATLIAQTLSGSTNGVDVTITGIIDVPLPGFSKRVVYTHFEHSQKLLRLGDRYVELAVRLKPEVDAFKWVKRMQPVVQKQNVELRGWWSIDPLIKKIEGIWDSVSGILCLLLLISAALTVVNVIFMMVNERIVEIGTLMAIGAKRRMIKQLFGMEGMILGAFGGLAGLVIGNCVVFTMGKFGVPLESPFGGGVEIIYPKVSLGLSAIGFFLTVIGCGLCALPPARKAAHVEPVQAFRNQI